MHFDVIVIGGGHAGIEAAAASSRLHIKTLLLTQNLDTIGQMSCNPSIGGVGKGHLVKEIDALDGLMAKAIDHAGIQFRILNASKGPAVRATRAQADRTLYKQAIINLLSKQSDLLILQQTVEDLIIENDQVHGIITNLGITIKAKCVILTVGTFLNGILHTGLESLAGGRAGDPPSLSLAQKLHKLPLRIGRLKTGTPPRIASNSIDYSELQPQQSDNPLPIFSFMGKSIDHPMQIPCHLTHTNEQTHSIIRAGLSKSPLYTGIINSIGPRYCPSIEDKITRFADKISHQIFLEPEGLNSNEVYPNGISTSLAWETQLDLIHSIKGLKNAQITRFGYAIEYDFFDARDLLYSLETKTIKGLFLAGQINGTTGYEEAAAQGLIAGLNAALKCKDMEPWCPKREESYIGVMIDDLITRGTNEPYRMFTSRAEYRLLLREDNADLRLTQIGHTIGLVDEERWKSFNQKYESIEQAKQLLKNFSVFPNNKNIVLEHEYKALELLKRPEISYSTMKAVVGNDLAAFNDQVLEQIEIQIKYAGYITRQEQEINKHKKYLSTKIPRDFNYDSIISLSNEVRQKLKTVQPLSVEQASRIPGITPAAISLLVISLTKHTNCHLNKNAR